MITIKKNSYNDGEKSALQIAFQAAVSKFINTYCSTKVRCEHCEYKHLCNDIIKARDYAYRISKEVDAK